MIDYAAVFYDRYSTALVADSAYRAGVPLNAAPSGLAPLDRRHKLAGPVQTVEAENDLVVILSAVHNADEGDVVVISNRTREVGLIGDLLTLEAKRKGLAGFVVDGLVRDSADILEIGLPVVCRGVWPVGPLKLPASLKGIGQIGVDIALGDATVHAGDWVFADADGVVFVQRDHLEDTFEAAERSRKGEERLVAEIESGGSLGDALRLDAFLALRAEDPTADFNVHVASLERAV